MSTIFSLKFYPLAGLFKNPQIKTDPKMSLIKKKDLFGPQK